MVFDRRGGGFGGGKRKPPIGRRESLALSGIVLVSNRYQKPLSLQAEKKKSYYLTDAALFRQAGLPSIPHPLLILICGSGPDGGAEPPSPQWPGWKNVSSWRRRAMVSVGGVTSAPSGGLSPHVSLPFWQAVAGTPHVLLAAAAWRGRRKPLLSPGIASLSHLPP